MVLFSLFKALLFLKAKTPKERWAEICIFKSQEKGVQFDSLKIASLRPPGYIAFLVKTKTQSYKALNSEARRSLQVPLSLLFVEYTKGRRTLQGSKHTCLSQSQSTRAGGLQAEDLEGLRSLGIAAKSKALTIQLHPQRPNNDTFHIARCLLR